MSLFLEWFEYSMVWYVVLLAIGILFLPMTRAVFGRFYDYGYGLSKVIGIILISYAMFVLGTVRVLPFSQNSLMLIAGVVSLFAYE